MSFIFLAVVVVDLKLCLAEQSQHQQPDDGDNYLFRSKGFFFLLLFFLGGGGEYYVLR